MANKTYYEQNYPTTKYEHSSRGYRNERMHSGDSRKVKMRYSESSAKVNPDYCYCDNSPVDEGYEKDGEDHWNSLRDCCDQKHKLSIHGPCKRSLNNNQPLVNTPRYYRNSVHRRPSALCIPMLAQPESTVRRKSKSQSRVDTSEREQKTVRYRVKPPRHHLLPPPPTLPHQATQQPEQTDFDTSSGDGRRSLQSHTQSSGSLSVDISSQVETLNQSFNAVTKERRGKKIIYGDLEPVYTNVDPSYNNHMKQKRTYRRHSRRHKHTEPLENWATELWDLPEENQDQDWLDKAETEWSNVEHHNNRSRETNIDNPLRKTRSKKHQQHHPHDHNYQPQQLVVQQTTQPSHLVPSKLLNPSLPRPRTRGSHASSKDSKDLHVNDVPRKTDTFVPNPGTFIPNQEDKTEKISFLENLFSEVFAQGCVEKLSKRTKLDFIKEAYDKYSASVEDPEKNNDVKDQVMLHNPESYPSETQDSTKPWKNEFINPMKSENKLKNYQLSFENTDSQLRNSTIKNISSENAGKADSSVQLVNANEIGSHNKIDQKGVNNFLLGVKPRRRSMKINGTEGEDKDNIINVPKFPEQERDSIPRFPNLIENMSARYIGSSSLKKTKSGGHPENLNKRNHSSRSVPSNFSNSSQPLQKQPSREYALPNPSNQNQDFNSVSHLQKEPDVNNEQFAYKTDGGSNKQVAVNCRCSSDTFQYAEKSCVRDGISLDQTKNIHPVNYANSNNADYLDNSFSAHQGDCYNYSTNEDFNKLNISSNSCDNNDDYSSNMENNYKTIKRCQEILNQVKENFGEHVKNNPDAFHVDAYYDTVNNGETNCVGGSDYHENCHSFHENAVCDGTQYKERDNSGYENEMKISNSGDCDKNYYYQRDVIRNYSRDETFKHAECNQMHGVERNLYSGEGKQTLHNRSESLERTGCMNRSNEPRSNEENSTGNNEVSNYEAIDQEKIKQFIHSLTGFDAVQRRDITDKGEISRCGAEYSTNVPNFQSPNFDHINSQETYSNAISPNVCISEQHYQSENNSHFQMNQSFQQTHEELQLHLKSKGAELTNPEGRKHYSIPQRNEIERMQQDSLRVDASISRENQGPPLTYQNFHCDVSYQNKPTSNNITSMSTSEPENTDIFRLRKAQNNTNLVENENYEKSIPNEMHRECENASYPYEYNYYNEQEQQGNENFPQNQVDYFGSSVGATKVSSAPHNTSQKNIHRNAKINRDTYSTDCNFNESSNHQNFYNHEHHYCVNDSNTRQYSNENISYNINDMNSPNFSAANNDTAFDGYNETSGFENDYPVDSDDTKTTVLKRKYYFMPSENYDGGVEKYGEGSMSDQSLYKTYIENLIDNSLQTTGHEGSQNATIQNVKQGAIIQNQSDVVELETDKAIDLVMNESSCQMDSKLCLEITQRLTDTLVQSHKDIPTPCLVALEEPVYLQQLKKLRWDHLRHIEREVKRLESLERFLDTCGCGHMMYTKNTC